MSLSPATSSLKLIITTSVLNKSHTIPQGSTVTARLLILKVSQGTVDGIYVFSVQILIATVVYIRSYTVVYIQWSISVWYYPPSTRSGCDAVGLSLYILAYHKNIWPDSVANISI